MMRKNRLYLWGRLHGFGNPHMYLTALIPIYARSFDASDDRRALADRKRTGHLLDLDPLWWREILPGPIAACVTDTHRAEDMKTALNL